MYEDRIPYQGKDAKRLHRPDDLTLARKMHVKAIASGLYDDYIIAAELFEKCQHYDDARVCREDAELVK
jgi:hypothetical protein